MEQLTKRDTDGQAMMDCEKCKADWTDRHSKPMVNCTALYCRNRLLDRLVEYEDTGLTPEDCAEYRKFEDEIIASGKTFGRLAELLRADKEGRVIVLPCVKYCEEYRWQNVTWDAKYGICAGCHNTCEEAEKALRRGEK